MTDTFPEPVEAQPSPVETTPWEAVKAARARLAEAEAELLEHLRKLRERNTNGISTDSLNDQAARQATRPGGLC